MKMPSVSFLAEVFRRNQNLFAQDSVELFSLCCQAGALSCLAVTWDIRCSQWSPRASQHSSDLSFSTAVASSVFVECLNVSLRCLFLPHRKERWRREGMPAVPSSQQGHRTRLPAGPLRPQSHGWKPGHYDSPGVRSVQIALSLGCIREIMWQWVLLLDAQKTTMDPWARGTSLLPSLICYLGSIL